MMNAYRNIDRSKYQFDFVIYEEFADVRPYHDEIAALGGKVFVVPNPNKHPLRYIKTVSKLLQENQVDIVHNERLLRRRPEPVAGCQSRRQKTHRPQPCDFRRQRQPIPL